MRDLAAFIPDCVTTARRLRKDPRVPLRAKIAVVVAGLWVASPIDLIPEFIPIIGPLDDIVVVALALRYSGRQVPRHVLLAAWPGEPRLIERLLGQASTDAIARRFGVIAAIAALVMSFARVYVAAHYPADVIAGLAVGGTVAAAVKLVARRRAARLVGALAQTRLRPLLAARASAAP